MNSTEKEDMLKFWDYTANLMDDDIREKLNLELAPCSNEEFLNSYLKQHFEKYGEEFCI